MDLAYLKWSYKPVQPIWNKVPQFSITGGRMPSPWYSTDLVWDGDVNFEGMALNLQSDTLEGSTWNTFLTAGAFPLQEVELAQKDKWLFGYQTGVAYRPSSSFSSRLAVAYYDYRNIKGEINAPMSNLKDYTMPLFQQKGNSLYDIDPTAGEKPALAADYEVINITGEMDIGRFHPIHVIVKGDYVNNIGFDADEVARLAKTTKSTVESLTGTEGYQIGLTVGHPEILDFGDWQTSLSFKHLESDAVLDAFTDSDFHLGGTNAKGWILGWQFGLYRNVWFSAKWLTSDEIKGPPLAIDVLQMDVNAKY
jgi:hypothetical protein